MRWWRRNFGRSQAPTTRPSADAPAADLDALLGRPPVSLDTPELQRFIAGKRVLVSGAGGSIGSEICRQMMRFCPGRLVLLDRAEPALFEIDRELRHRWVGAELVPALADVADAARVERIFSEHLPQVVFHAAAHKHVPLLETNPGEAIKNNVVGTRVLADAAVRHGAASFVLISTDKAVNPTSVMGASKRVAELYVQSLNGHGATRLLAVRFGNVLGSSGSVLPIFRRQIAEGGPVTVTHPQMRRFFMTIPEASQLVMQAGAIGQGGEIFVLDMGQPVRILDLAETLIRQHGLRPGVDIQVRISGIRPGEKLDEELARDDEQTAPTAHPKIRVWLLEPAPHERIAAQVQALVAQADADPATILRCLRAVVPEYASAGDVLPDQAQGLRRLAEASARAA